MSRPLFTIIMRTCRRPTGSERSLQSVLAQTCRDWEALFLLDKSYNHHEGNILWANSQFYYHRDKPAGHYCIALDDDGIFPNKDFLGKVRAAIYGTGFPECVLVRCVSNKPGGGYHNLPSKKVWRLDWDSGERPNSWYGNGYNWVVRKDIFSAFVGSYCKPRGGDWFFMTSLIQGGVDFVKCDVFGGKSLSRGRGEKFEHNVPDNWFEAFAKKYGIVKINEEEWRLNGKA